MQHTNQVKCPIIGISATLLMIESGCLMGRERSAVGYDYIRAIQQAGGVPVVLPIVNEHHLIQQQIEIIDGLLLSGGYDVSPLCYGEDPKPGLEAICPERDIYEIELVQSAQRSNKPIFGICRGLQLLNVALGGTLYQDINLSIPSALQHQSKAKPDEATHAITISSQSLLHSIMNETKVLTNSFHHQAIKDLAPDLVVNAQSSDGVIEGVESPGPDFILGVQWHPELMIEKHSNMLKIFQAFLEAAKKRRRT